MVSVSNENAKAIVRLLREYRAILPASTIKGRETQRKIDKTIKILNDHELFGSISKVQDNG